MNQIVSHFLTGSSSRTNKKISTKNVAASAIRRPTLIITPNPENFYPMGINVPLSTRVHPMNNPLEYPSANYSTEDTRGMYNSNSINTSRPGVGISSKIYNMRQAFHDSIDKSMFDSPKYAPFNVGNYQMVDPTVIRVNSNPPKESNNLIKIADEMNDNLELFKIEMTSELKKLHRGHQKIKMVDFAGEIKDMKTKFTGIFEDTHKKRVESINKLLDEFKIVRNEIATHISTEISRNETGISALSSNLNHFKDEMYEKLSQLGSKQKIQIEQVNTLLYHSNNEKLQYLAKKILPTQTSEEFAKAKESYIAPSKEDIDVLAKHISRKLKKPDTLSPDDEMMKELNKKKEKNTIIKEDMDEEEQSLTEFQKQTSGLVVGDLVKLMRREEFKKNLPVIKKKVIECNWKKYPITSTNKLRSYVYVVILRIRLDKEIKVVDKKVTVESLKYFVENYLLVEDYLQNWVKVSTKKAMAAISNFSTLNIDITEDKNSKSKEIKEKFVKLQIRLKGFLEQLIENTNQAKFNASVAEFFKCLFQEPVIPFKFFTFFELSRLNISSVSVRNFNDNQKIMVICIYILLKLLIKNLIIDTVLPSTTNPQVNKNFKVIASIYYHTIINYFQEICPILTEISSMDSVIQRQSVFEVDSIGDESEQELKRLSKMRIVDKGYKKAVMRYYENQAKKSKSSSRNEGKLNRNKEESQLLAKINSKIKGIEQDDDCNEIKGILLHLHEGSDLAMYFSRSKEIGFDLMEMVLELANKILNIVK